MPPDEQGACETDNVTQSWAGGTLRLATHVHLVLGALRELQLAVAQGEQGVVLAATDVLAGWMCVPRWRTMTLPVFTAWPANIFTPRRCARESRPLRLEPRPFLCAMVFPPYAYSASSDAGLSAA